MELARLCGVSVVTTNRALQGRADVSPVTRRHVLDMARRHGYRVNSAARAMRRGRFGQIGLLQSTTFCRANMSPITMWAIEQELHELNLLLCTGQLSDTELSADGTMPRLLTDWSVDGLLISYTGGQPEHMVAELAQSPVPAVWVNSIASDCSVRPDDVGAGIRGTAELLKLGHRKIAHLSFSGGIHPHHSVYDRREGYLKAMQAAGASPLELYEVPNRILRGSEALQSVRKWLSGPDRPTALFCYSTGEGVFALHAAVSNGLRVPEDLSIVVVNDEPTMPLGPTMSTVVLPCETMGRRAVQMLMSLIEHPGQEVQPMVLECAFVAGDTTAEARR
jgi:LacI family transcriptional regulator